MNEAIKAASRINKYLVERAKMSGFHQEEIALLHSGEEREAALTVSDMKTVLVSFAQLQQRITELGVERDADVLNGLELAISVVPGGSICDPQQVVDAIRAIASTLKKDSEQ